MVAGVAAEAAHHLSLFLTTPGSSASSNQVIHKIDIVDQVSPFNAHCPRVHADAQDFSSAVSLLL